MSKTAITIERRECKFTLILYRGTYCAKFYNSEGKRCRLSLATKDKDEASRRLTEIAENYADVFDEHDREMCKDASVADLWPMFAKSLSGKASAEQLPYVWKALEPVFGNLMARSIRSEDSIRHIDKRRRDGIMDGTIHTELGILQMLVNWSFKEKLIPNKSRIIRPSKPSSKTQHLTGEQISKLFGEIKSPHIMLFVQLALTTGARKTALLELTWDRVNFDENFIDLNNPDDPMRRKKRAKVPLRTNTKKVLLEAHRAALSDHVIEYNGKPVSDVKKALKRAGERAGMPWFAAHALRHTAAVQMAKERISMPEIAQYLGHSNSRITEETYARFSPDYMGEASSVLEKLISQSNDSIEVKS